MESSLNTYLKSLKTNASNLNDSANALLANNVSKPKDNTLNTKNTASAKDNLTFEISSKDTKFTFGAKDESNIKSTFENISNSINNNIKNLTAEVSEDTKGTFLKISEVNSDNYSLVRYTDNKFLVENKSNEESNFKTTVNTKNDNPDDKEQYAKNVEALVTNVNNITKFANSNINDFKGAFKIKTDLAKIMQSDKEKFEAIGFDFQKDGTIKVDSKKLQESIDKDFTGVKNLISTKDGLSDNLLKEGSEIINSPYNYSKPASFDTNYKNFMNYMNISNNSTPWQNLYKGLLVNELI